jgi:predicted GIY-YIG superfamily endonuclease
MSYRVYVIHCMAITGRVTIHVGIAKDVARRVHEHSCGKVKATRGRLVSWLGNSKRMSEGDALRLERKLRRMSRYNKLRWAEQQKEHA